MSGAEQKKIAQLTVDFALAHEDRLLGRDVCARGIIAVSRCSGFDQIGQSKRERPNRKLGATG